MMAAAYSGRTLALAGMLVAALGGCDTYRETPPEFVAAVTGTVVDSLSGRAVRNAVVVFGEDSVVADSLGTFILPMVDSAAVLEVRHRYWFAPFAIPMTNDHDTTVVLRVRRVVPYVRNVAVSGTGLVTGTIVHLPGASRVIQDNTDTWLVYLDSVGTQGTPIPATAWSWQAVDAVTWQVSVQLPVSVVSELRWEVADSTQLGSLTYCVVAPAGCDDFLP